MVDDSRVGPPRNPPNDILLAYMFTIGAVVILALVGYIFARNDDAQREIFRMAEDLVTGALGFFAGHGAKVASVTPQAPWNFIPPAGNPTPPAPSPAQPA